MQTSADKEVNMKKYIWDFIFHTGYQVQTLVILRHYVVRHQPSILWRVGMRLASAVQYCMYIL